MQTLTQSRRLRYVSFFYLYFMQGVPGGFALTAVTNYLAAEGVNAQTIANFGALVGLPWGFKFVWGPLVDRYQGWAMGQRRPWVLISQIMALLASLSLLLVNDPVADFNGLVMAFALHGVFASLQDVSVDAMAITIVPAAERGRANALMKIGLMSGQALGAAGLALLLRQVGFQAAALLQSTVLFALTLVTFFIRERPQDVWLSFRYSQPVASPTMPHSFIKLLKDLGRAMLTRQSLLLFAAVATVFIGERLFQRVYQLHLIQKLGWSDTSVSVLSGTYGPLVAVGIALAGGWLSDRLGAMRMLRGTVLVMALIFIGFSLEGARWVDPAVATGGLVMRQTMESVFSIAALPVLMSLCRREVAGAQFGFYMALSNQADVLGIYLSGPLFNQYSAPAIGLGCGLAMLVASVLVGLTSRRTHLAHPY